MRYFGHALFALATLAAVLASAMYLGALSDPVVRRARIVMPDWPDKARPIRVLLLSDTHVAGPDMPPRRLARIVGRLNQLDADLVVIAGDLVGDRSFAARRYSIDASIAPLGGLKAPLGVFAVLGNHDHWRDAGRISDALGRRAIRVLANDVERRGPVTIVGFDDEHTGHDDVPLALRRLGRARGPIVAISHSPDLAPDLPPGLTLLLSGHTHCGQIDPPLITPSWLPSRYGQRYACGLIRDGRRTVVVTAGLGTSAVPLRYGAPPDVWLLTLARR